MSISQQSIDFEDIRLSKIFMDFPEDATHLNARLLSDIFESVIGEISDGTLEVVELSD